MMLKILVMTMMNSLKRHPTCSVPCEAGKTLPTQILGSRLVWPLAPPRFAASLPLHDHTSKIPVGPWAFFSANLQKPPVVGEIRKTSSTDGALGNHRFAHLILIQLFLDPGSKISLPRCKPVTKIEGLGWDSRY